MTKHITLNVTGCCLVDTIIEGVDFCSKDISPYISKVSGDGGLATGALVLLDDLEEFTGVPLTTILSDIEPTNAQHIKNIGGPAIIALVCAAQMLYQKNISFNFFQHYGNDKNGEYILNQLKRYAPSINLSNYTKTNGKTSETTVLSDPFFADGAGERLFIHSMGVAQKYLPQNLEHSFFDAEILLFAATALCPALHNNLQELLAQGKANTSMNIVTTVFDFINEKKSADQNWPLGRSEAVYPLIDLLITDHVEALRLTGTHSNNQAITQFKEWGLPALIITNGADDVHFYAAQSSSYFALQEKTQRPALQVKVDGDTTGCGDNFAGAVICSIIEQTVKEQNMLNISDAVDLGNCGGALACASIGGMLRETIAGEKLQRIHALKSLIKN